MQDPFIITTCGHSFEKRNIVTWLEKKNTCPLCQRKATKDNLIPNFTLKGILIDKINELKKKH